MGYEIKLSKQALKFLKKYPFKERIKVKLNELAENPFGTQLDIKKVAGKRNIYRLRVGDIRLIYSVSEKEGILVLKADNRGDVFRRHGK